MYYQIVRGLDSKIHQFYSNVSDCEYNIVALSETWLKPEVNSCELFSDYPVYRSDRKFDRLELVAGGGVLLAVDCIIKSETVDTSYFEDYFPEIGFSMCKCCVSFKSFYIAVVYIPPSFSFDKFDHFGEALADWNMLTDNVMIVGDLNCSNFVYNSLYNSAPQ